MNIYIDSHTHLQSYTTKYLPKGNSDITTWQQAYEYAQNNNVIQILNIFDLSDEKDMSVICEMYNKKNIYIACGVHPCSVNDISLENAHKKLVNIIHNIDCVGEIGIDIYTIDNNFDLQIEFLKMQLKIAYTYDKCVSIHFRNKNTNNEQFIDILYNILLDYEKIRFVIHCCTFNYETIQKLLYFENCYISISGIVTYKNAKDIHDLARKLPLNRMLIETDSPFLTPLNMNKNLIKNNNQSAYIIYIYEEICKIKNINLITLQQNVFHNFMKFLNKI